MVASCERVVLPNWSSRQRRMHPVPLHRVTAWALAEQCGLGCREADRRLAHGADAELCPRVVEMEGDGTTGDAENAADLPGRLALGGPPEAFELAARQRHARDGARGGKLADRKSTRLNSSH